jgi:hypothetical protein
LSTAESRPSAKSSFGKDRCFDVRRHAGPFKGLAILGEVCLIRRAECPSIGQSTVKFVRKDALGVRSNDHRDIEINRPISGRFDALVQAVEGEAEITVAGKPIAVKPGDVVLLPADKPHGVKATTRFKMVLTMIRS